MLLLSAFLAFFLLAPASAAELFRAFFAPAAAAAAASAFACFAVACAALAAATAAALASCGRAASASGSYGFLGFRSRGILGQLTSSDAARRSASFGDTSRSTAPSCKNTKSREDRRTFRGEVRIQRLRITSKVMVS